MKRFFVDWIGNLIFFVPLVLLLSRAWTWPSEAVIAYLVASVPVAAIGGRGYVLFLKHMWYPLWGEKF